MMPESIARLEHDEVEPQGQVRKRRAVRKGASLEQAVRRRPNPSTLAPIDRFLRQAEVAIRAPTNLDRHQHAGWSRVHCHEVQLMASDVDVPPKNRPSRGRQVIGNQLLGVVPRLLRIGPHRGTVASAD